MRSRLPKVLHRVCGQEMLRLVVDAAKGAGFDDITVVVPADSAAFEEALGDTVGYAVQSEPLGSGHALLQARESLEGVDNVAVLYGDVPLVRPETLDSIMRLHLDREACATLLTADLSSPDGLGRVIRDASGSVSAIVEQSDVDDATRAVTEVNAGVYCFRASWLWPSLDSLAPSPGGEVYLTDVVSIAARQEMEIASVHAESPQETLGVNTRVDLAQAESALRQRIRTHWMLSGVTMPDPASVYVDVGVELGRDTVVLPNSHITAGSRIGDGCEVGPNTIIEDSQVGDGCVVVASVVRGSTLDDEVRIGPFSNVRAGSHLERGVHLGSSAEVKSSRLGRGTRSGHFSYIGDAEVGANVNIGAGTVTCNYDGVRKHKTKIGDGALIGCDTMLVAPVTVGARAETGAGSVVTRDVPPDTLVKGVPARVGARTRKKEAG